MVEGPCPGRLKAPGRKALGRCAPELLADEAQVVGRLEVGDPVVEEADAVRLAKAIQFIEAPVVNLATRGSGGSLPYKTSGGGSCDGAGHGTRD